MELSGSQAPESNGQANTDHYKGGVTARQIAWTGTVAGRWAYARRVVWFADKQYDKISFDRGLLPARQVLLPTGRNTYE